MKLSYQESMKKISKGDVATIYCLVSEESTYLGHLVDRLKHHFSSLKDNIDTTTLHGSDSSLKETIEIAKNISLFGNRQFLIVKEMQSLIDLKQKTMQSILSKYLNSPNKYTTLIVWFNESKISLPKKLTEDFTKNAYYIEAKKLYGKQVTKWMKTHLQKDNILIEEEACSLLTNYIGTDIKSLRKELDKIINGEPNIKTIDIPLIIKYSNSNKKYSLFELQSAIANKNFVKAYTIMKHFEKTPKDTPPILITNFLFSFFTKVLSFNSNSNTINNRNYFLFRDHITARKNYSTYNLLEILKFLQRVDMNLKGIESNFPPFTILNDFILKTLRK